MSSGALPSRKALPRVEKNAGLAHPVIGAHVNGGMKAAVGKAVEIGAQCLQIFIGSPQMWKEPRPSPKEINDFQIGVAEHKLGPVFVHGTYLVNLAAGNPDNLEKSVSNLRAGLFMADRVGAAGLIFHPGSSGQSSYKEALDRVLRSLEAVLADYDGACRLVLEVCAGQGETIGHRFCQFQDVLSAMGHDRRLGVCWDTCHLFAAGYDVSTSKGLSRTVEEFAELIGFDWLVAVHANDSKAPLGSRRDRHENIGKGFIGSAAFERMLGLPELRAVPWILEVPGLERKGPDRANIELLRQLAGI